MPSRNRNAMNYRVKLRTYEGYPAASQIFTLFMIACIFVSFGLCIVAKQPSTAAIVLISAFVLAVTSVIVADRRKKKREGRYIEEVIQEANRQK